MQILAISGSLRTASSNAALLRAAMAAAPETITIKLYEGLGHLPIFNPDLDDAGAPPSVMALRSQIQAADGLLIASPEYAHGVPGGLKNALDWLVAGNEFIAKPVALFHASPRGEHARIALGEILVTMSASLVTEASIMVPLLGKTQEEVKILLADPHTIASLRKALITFARVIEARRL